MSYARFSDTSNVYVYAHVGGFIECCGCPLSDEWAYHSREAIVRHMQEHVDAGHLVPPHLLDIDTYDDGDFVAMCSAFMCRQDAGHGGDHSKHRWGVGMVKDNPYYRCPCRYPRSHPIHEERAS